MRGKKKRAGLCKERKKGPPITNKCVEGVNEHLGVWTFDAPKN